MVAQETGSSSQKSGDQKSGHRTTGEWVLLSYRIPREPSTPRIAVWRKLKDLGVVQLGDGLVALPNTPETREQLEWNAARVREADGEAMVWIAQPSAKRENADLVDRLRSARTEEYDALAAEVNATAEVGPRAIARWRRQWRKIERRDHFRSPGGDEAKQAINDALTRSDASLEHADTGPVQP